jgi:hypothetical protein
LQSTAQPGKRRKADGPTLAAEAAQLMLLFLHAVVRDAASFDACLRARKLRAARRHNAAAAQQQAGEMAQMARSLAASVQGQAELATLWQLPALSMHSARQRLAEQGAPPSLEVVLGLCAADCAAALGTVASAVRRKSDAALVRCLSTRCPVAQALCLPGVLTTHTDLTSAFASD